jgi:hypothetical protein
MAEIQVFPQQQLSISAKADRFLEKFDHSPHAVSNDDLSGPLHLNKCKSRFFLTVYFLNCEQIN